jgi:integrase
MCSRFGFFFPSGFVATPVTPATVRKLFALAEVFAKLPFPIHLHILRHSTGYQLANDEHDTPAIQQYLGHKNITHSARYTDPEPQPTQGVRERLNASV